MHVMDDVRVIKSGGQTLAIFVHRGVAVPDGMRFFTTPDQILQTGIFERDTGYRVAAHKHREHAGPSKLGEFLYIESGRAKVTVYHDDWTVAGEEVVGTGDFLLLLEGGHAVEMLEPTRFIEVKQGPYPGDAVAKIFRDHP